MSDKLFKKYISFRKISTSLNAILGLIKIILAIFSNSILLFIYSFYNISMSIAKRTSVREKQKYEYENFYFCGIIVLISSISYVLYSDYIYFNGSNAEYHMYIAIGIATLAFYNITVAIIGLIRAKKRKDIKNQTIKLTNLASSFISMSLTQTAILSFTTKSDMSKYNAIGGIIFGMLSAIVGIYMIIYTIRMKSKELEAK